MKIHDAVGASTVERRLIPVTEWPIYHAWPTTSSLRSLIFFAATNGFGTAIRRVGRRVLIDERAFFEWVDRQGANHG